MWDNFDRDEGRYGDSGWDMHGGLGWGGWVLMVIAVLLLVALVVAVVIALLRMASTGPQPGAGGARRSRAEEVLDERFARGEIDEEEYQRRRAVLRPG